jgi:RNase adaptor protein for sRNA GlmZ degradation
MLKIRVNSFSFIYGQIPTDAINGGGHVFDCRALPNPGRYKEYKQLTGQDEAVVEYLLKEKEVHQFLDLVYAIVEQSVEKYLERDFTDLMISFGCTGGQHRSVFSAEQLSQHLADKYEDVIVVVRHIAREEAANKK